VIIEKCLINVLYDESMLEILEIISAAYKPTDMVWILHKL